MSTSLLNSLKSPFPYASLCWDIGTRNEQANRGRVFPRIDSRDIQERLDELVGPTNWRVGYAPGPAHGGVFCTLELFIDGQWIAKTDIGYRAQSETLAGRAQDRRLEISLKVAAADAFNRAAAMWGIGRYLYKFTPPYVALSKKGRYVLAFPPVPDEFLPENERGTRPWEAMQQALQSGKLTSTRHGIALPETVNKNKSARSASPARALRAVEDRPLIGSADQWRELAVELRREIAVLHNRIVNGLELDAVEEFLQGPRAEMFPPWAREALEEMLIEQLDKASSADMTSSQSQQEPEHALEPRSSTPEDSDEESRANETSSGQPALSAPLPADEMIPAA